MIQTINSPSSMDSIAAQKAKTATPNALVGHSATTTQNDSVSLSDEAIQAQRKEQYALKTDPVAFYNDWLETDPRYISIPGAKPYEALLPETQAYVDQLNQRLTSAKTPEQRMQIENFISGASSYGDKEIIQSDSDVQTRWRVEETAVSLMISHLFIHNEPLAVPEGLQGPVNRPNEGRFPNLSQEVVIQQNQKVGISREQTLVEFENIEKQNRQNLESFFYGWLNGQRTFENSILGEGA